MPICIAACGAQRAAEAPDKAPRPRRRSRDAGGRRRLRAGNRLPGDAQAATRIATDAVANRCRHAPAPPRAQSFLQRIISLAAGSWSPALLEFVMRAHAKWRVPARQSFRGPACPTRFAPMPNRAEHVGAGTRHSVRARAHARCRAGRRQERVARRNDQPAGRRPAFACPAASRRRPLRSANSCSTTASPRASRRDSRSSTSTTCGARTSRRRDPRLDRAHARFRRRLRGDIARRLSRR